MADEKNENKIKISTTKGIKQIQNLQSAQNAILDKIKAFPLNRSNRENDELNSLRNEIDSVIHKENDRLVSANAGASGKDMAMFLQSLFNKMPKTQGFQDMNPFGNQTINEFMNDQNTQLNLILSERYKNVNSLYEDIKLVSEQLSELSEVIDTFRDAIVNADNLISDISRILKFRNRSSDTNSEIMQTVTSMEEHTQIKDKLKKVIIPEMLKYGNIFVFTQPYRDLFAKFKAMDDKYAKGIPGSNGRTMYSMTRIGESYTPTMEDMCAIDNLYASFESDFNMAFMEQKTNESKGNNKKISKENFEELVNTYINENITVINDPMVPLLESSDISSLSSPDVRASIELAIKNKKKDKLWKPISNTDSTIKYSDGILAMNGNTKNTIEDSEKEYQHDFKDITGVYMKIYDPRRVIPIYVMDYCIGYYLMYETVEETTTNVLNAVHTLSRTTMLFQNDKKREFETRFVSLIAERICRSIDKPFLKKNKQFKNLIANAISYDNFYTKNFRVQFVTANYITHFKINEDYNTHMGRSILYRSMFYAMLYLTILLFYIIMYVTKSGDTRLLLVRSNGTNKDVNSRLQTVIKEYKQAQINYNDFGSVRGILSKVGRGKDIAVPVGVNGERSLDMEQLSGNTPDFNDALLELLRKSMISNTGCPSAMLNYIDEVDFAKQIQMLHSKFVSRCVSMQEETETSITELYRKLLSYGDYSISDEDIENFYFEWARPKSLNNQNMGDLISTTEQLAEFIIKVLEGDNSINDARIKDRIFSHIVKKYLMNGTFDWDSIENEVKKLRLELRSDLHEEDATKIKTEES